MKGYSLKRLGPGIARIFRETRDSFRGLFEGIIEWEHEREDHLHDRETPYRTVHDGTDSYREAIGDVPNLPDEMIVSIKTGQYIGNIPGTMPRERRRAGTEVHF